MKEQIREILMNETLNISNQYGDVYTVIDMSSFNKVIDSISDLKSVTQTKDLLIAMLESQLKVESILNLHHKVHMDKDYLLSTLKLNELERQLKELKG